MLANFQFVLFMCSLALLPFWLIDQKFIRARSIIIVATSIVILAVISLQSLLIALLILIQALVMLKLQPRFKFARSIWFSALIFVPLFVNSALESSIGFPFETIGLSYYSLKMYSLLRDFNRAVEKPQFYEILLYIFFFPVFSVGPIENYKSLSPQVLNNRFSLDELVYGCVRVLVGVFKVVYLADALLLPMINQYSLESIAAVDAWLWTALGFAYLYLNFSGFSDIAIGISRWFGIHIRENFNHPYLAKNIQEFWQRWHMSLGGWVSQYLYFPLVRNNGKPLASLALVFVLMGAWHHFSYNYLIWGIMHGAAMAGVKFVDREFSQVDFVRAIRSYKVYSLFTCLLTLSYVAILSKFANFSTIEEGVSYLKVLF